MKAKRKNKLIIGIILTIGGVLTYQLAYGKYIVNRNVNLATGTINNSSDFQMAVKISDDKVNYSDSNSVPASGYTLNTSKSVCNVDNVKDSIITIEYSNGKINFLGATQKGTKCYLYFDKAITVDDIIAANNPKTSIPTFSSTAKTDEGVYSTTDGMYSGTTYYWRGAATTNHVIFANKCWRIVRINGDKTMRLIYNGEVLANNTCMGNGENDDAVILGSTYDENRYNLKDDNSSYVGWTYSLGSQRTLSGTSSNAKAQTEKWYSSNITGINVEKVADGKFCNDRNTQANWHTELYGMYYYAGFNRLLNNHNPTFTCNAGDTYTLKVGAITADEVMFAGGDGSANQSYYMYTGKSYWTMTALKWYIHLDVGNAHVFYITYDGRIDSNDTDYAGGGVRPVINLRSDVTFSSGNGTQNSPYTVS